MCRALFRKVRQITFNFWYSYCERSRGNLFELARSNVIALNRKLLTHSNRKLQTYLVVAAIAWGSVHQDAPHMLRHQSSKQMFFRLNFLENLLATIVIDFTKFTCSRAHPHPRTHTQTHFAPSIKWHKIIILAFKSCGQILNYMRDCCTNGVLLQGNVANDSKCYIIQDRNLIELI